ncbi:unnamed protein product [Amaranthus hypochondriacus]
MIKTSPATNEQNKTNNYQREDNSSQCCTLQHSKTTADHMMHNFTSSINFQQKQQTRVHKPTEQLNRKYSSMEPHQPAQYNITTPSRPSARSNSITDASYNHNNSEHAIRNTEIQQHKHQHTVNKQTIPASQHKLIHIYQSCNQLIIRLSVDSGCST